MSEENIQPANPEQPVLPQESAKVKPKPTGDWKGRRGALENLPIAVKEDMEEYMRRVNPNASKKYMVDKYGKDYPLLKDVSTVSYNHYFKRHNVRMQKELDLQKQSAPPPPEILDVINKITDPEISLADKRNALTALFNACEARNKLLQARQTNFIDPALEALILANRKEQRIIIEKVAVLNDQLTKESDKDWVGEAQNLVQVILSAVYNTYRLCHTDQSNFSNFSSSLGENITALLKNYKAAKEQIKKEN